MVAYILWALFISLYYGWWGVFFMFVVVPILALIIAGIYDGFFGEYSKKFKEKEEGKSQNNIPH